MSAQVFLILPLILLGLLLTLIASGTWIMIRRRVEIRRGRLVTGWRAALIGLMVVVVPIALVVVPMLLRDLILGAF